MLDQLLSLRFLLKIASTPYKVNKQTSEIKIDGLNLLLVEDNELNVEIAETLLLMKARW